MKKTFKKVISGVVAVVSLATEIIGISASASSASDTVYFGNCAVNNYVSCTSSEAYAYAECYNVECDRLEINITAYHMSYGLRANSNYVSPRGKVEVTVVPHSNNSFYKAECYSCITIDRSTATSRTITAYV